MKNRFTETVAAPKTQVTAQATYQADTLKDGVTVPLYKAGFLGAAVGLLAVLLLDAANGLLIRVLTSLESPWIPGEMTPGGMLQIFGIVALGVAIGGFVIYSRAGYWLLENITRRDLDGDGQVGAPAPEPPPEPLAIDVNLYDNSGNLVGGERDKLPYKSLMKLARGNRDGATDLAERYWIGQGNPFSQIEYRGMRDALIEQGYAVWNNDQDTRQGWKFTSKGKALMNGIKSRL